MRKGNKQQDRSYPLKAVHWSWSGVAMRRASSASLQERSAKDFIRVEKNHTPDRTIGHVCCWCPILTNPNAQFSILSSSNSPVASTHSKSKHRQRLQHRIELHWSKGMACSLQVTNQSYFSSRRPIPIRLLLQLEEVSHRNGISGREASNVTQHTLHLSSSLMQVN